MILRQLRNGVRNWKRIFDLPSPFLQPNDDAGANPAFAFYFDSSSSRFDGFNHAAHQSQTLIGQNI